MYKYPTRQVEKAPTIDIQLSQLKQKSDEYLYTYYRQGNDGRKSLQNKGLKAESGEKNHTDQRATIGLELAYHTS